MSSIFNFVLKIFTSVFTTNTVLLPKVGRSTDNPLYQNHVVSHNIAIVPKDNTHKEIVYILQFMVIKFKHIW